MLSVFILVLSLLCFGAPELLLAQSATPPLADLLIIVVDSPTQADKILQRLKNGEDFASLAKQFSIDPTASDGGSMGRVDPAALRPELREVVTHLSVGEMSSVIHTHSGYAILKMLSPAPAEPLQNTAPARILPSSATGTIRYAPNVGGK
jgi:parvulin-like peptidyl-prolyl isomerase